MDSTTWASSVPLPRLLAELRAWGVAYLTGGMDAATMVPAPARLPPLRLCRALAACDEPRVRDALIGLLLLHPELAPMLLQGVVAARKAGE